jgi:serine/arginine repetitive matrix protein 2
VLGGGGYVRRRSVGATFEASPCVKFEKKRKHANLQDMVYPPAYDDGNKDSSNKARIIEMPSIMSTSSSKFGGERMIKAQRGLLARESLEDSCLIAEGEDLTSREWEYAVVYDPSHILC